jgi:hypothetical protein
MRLRTVAVVACAGSLLVCAAPAGSQPRRARTDGGSGTYVATGRTSYFDLINTGTAAWQSFYLVGPPGTVFIGGANATEFSALCVVGQPDGQLNEIECGPLSPNVMPVSAHMAFTATLSAPVACGAPFQLAVSSTSVPPYTRGQDVTEVAASCIAATPRALVPPTVHGKPTVGHTLAATAPTWSSPPTSVTYVWQRCTASDCTSIPGTTGLRLSLTRRDAGRVVRLVASAIIDGVAVRTSSAKLAVPDQRHAPAHAQI